MLIRHAAAIAALSAAPAFAQTATIAVPAPVHADDARAGATPKLICKSSVDTGSLVARTRRCYTAADWARLDEGHRSLARAIVATNTGLLTSN